MAKLTFVPDSKTNNVVKIKQAKYIRRKRLWQGLFIVSFIINCALGSYIWMTNF